MMRKHAPFCSVTQLWTTLLFAVGVALFFTDAVHLPYKVAYPVLLLSVSVFTARQRTLLPFGAAFLFSAAGDAVGAAHLFIPQMLFFALAHVSYICYFLSRSQAKPRIGTVAVTAALLVFLFTAIVPCVSDSAERVGVGIYGTVIAAMLYSVLQYRGVGSSGFWCAALLFVFSDAVIAWNRFVCPVPGRTYVIMLTYYSAQYLFFWFACKSRKPQPDL